MENEIIVVDYNPIWGKQFDELKSVLIEYIDNESIEIEHVGSTSIPGLKAKPIIDLDIILEEDISLKEMVIKKLVLDYNE